MIRHRIFLNGAVVADLSDHEPIRLGRFSAPRGWIGQGGRLPEDYTAESYERKPPPPPQVEPSPPDPSRVVLDRSTFFTAVDSLAGLTPADLLPDEWLVQQIEASAVLPVADKRRALILVLTAQRFHRDHPFMDALSGAIMGRTPAELDAAFLDAAGGMETMM